MIVQEPLDAALEGEVERRGQRTARVRRQPAAGRLQQKVHENGARRSVVACRLQDEGHGASALGLDGSSQPAAAMRSRIHSCRRLARRSAGGDSGGWGPAAGRRGRPLPPR